MELLQFANIFFLPVHWINFIWRDQMHQRGEGSENNKSEKTAALFVVYPNIWKLTFQRFSIVCCVWQMGSERCGRY